MKNSRSIRKPSRFLALSLLVCALSALALATPVPCSTTYPECNDDVESGVITSTTCGNPSSEDQVDGPYDFTLMTCEGRSPYCGNEGVGECNILTYRVVQVNLIDCGTSTKFCVAQGTGSGTPVNSGRRCSDYGECTGSSVPVLPLPYPLYDPYVPNDPRFL